MIGFGQKQRTKIFHITKHTEHLKLIAAFAAGAIANFGFLNPGIFAASIAALAVLFYFWDGTTPKRCALLGFLFGVGLYSIGVSWLYISIHEYGQAHGLFAAFVVMILVSYLAGIIALCGYAQAKIQVSRTLKYLLLIPALWVILEWSRGWLFTGFPWLYVGYSQVDVWFAGWAPITGVLGVSFVCCAVAGAVTIMLKSGLKLSMFLVIATLLAIGAAGQNVKWSTPQNSEISVAFIQGDFSTSEKWNRRMAVQHLQFFVEKSRRLSDKDLVIWPEVAIAYTDQKLEKLKLWDLLQRQPSDFLVGVLEVQQAQEENIYYNSAYGIADDIQKYRKHRLVPFGEYTPFRKLLTWAMQFVLIPASDMRSYTNVQQPLALAGHLAGISICYEDVFPTEILKMLPAADFLINISEDAWFGEKLAPHQRLQMSRMRAIETSRPVLRAANKGISAAIDHNGTVKAQLPQAKGKVLETTIVPTTGTTPFVRLGNYPIVIVCFAILITLVIYSRRRNLIRPQQN